jgi:hypothetical protein
MVPYYNLGAPKVGLITPILQDAVFEQYSAHLLIQHVVKHLLGHPYHRENPQLGVF